MPGPARQARRARRRRPRAPRQLRGCSCASSGQQRGDVAIHGRQQRAALVLVQEGTGESVSGHGAQLLEGEAEMRGRALVLVHQRDAAHQAIVGAEHHVEAAVEVLAQGVRVERLGRPRLHVAGDAAFHGDAPVIHVLRERLVLDETRAVADAAHAAAVHGITHRFGAGALAGMAGARQVVFAREVEGFLVAAGRVPRLATGEVEAGDAPSLERHGQPRQLQRHLGRHVANGAYDDASHDAILLLGAGESAPSRSMASWDASSYAPFATWRPRCRWSWRGWPWRSRDGASPASTSPVARRGTRPAATRKPSTSRANTTCRAPAMPARAPAWQV